MAFCVLVTNVDGMDLLGSMTPEFSYLHSMWFLVSQATALQQRMFALRRSFTIRVWRRDDQRAAGLLFVFYLVFCTLPLLSDETVI